MIKKIKSIVKKIKTIIIIYKEYDKLKAIQADLGHLQYLQQCKVAQTKRMKKRTFSKQHKKIIWKRAGGMCQFDGCCMKSELTYDHIIPISKGGASHSKNGQLLCLYHNKMKGDRIE